MLYYRWPCGDFEVLGGPWFAMRNRPMPCTPQGDVVARFEAREQCDAAVQVMNEQDMTLEQARQVFDKWRT